MLTGLTIHALTAGQLLWKILTSAIASNLLNVVVVERARADCLTTGGGVGSLGWGRIVDIYS